MFLHGVRLNRCKRLLSREEKADLSFGLFVTGAAVKLIDRIVLYSELRSEADGGRTHTSALTAVVSLFCSSCCRGFSANYSNKALPFSIQGSVCVILSDLFHSFILHCNIYN